MATRKKNPGTYRVFLTKHFIDVLWVDINADSPLQARNKAEKVATERRPASVSRAEATDNGWHADDPIMVTQPGSFASGVHDMLEVDEGVFTPKSDAKKFTAKVVKLKKKDWPSGLGGVR